MPFADQEIGNRGTGMGRGHGADRRHDAVRGNRDVICLRQVGDLLSFREAAGLLKIRLDDVNGTFTEKLTISPAHVQVFSGGDGR